MKASQLFLGDNRCSNLVSPLLSLLVVLAMPCFGQVTQEQITNGLVSYYPLDQLVPGSTNATPDLVSRRDLIMYLGDSAHYMNGPAYIVADTHPGMGDSSNVMNLTQSPSPTVLVYFGTGQSALTGQGDFLPFINQRGATMNFWMKGAVPPAQDQRVMAECAQNGSGVPFFSLSSQPASKLGLGYFLRAATAGPDPNGVTAFPMFDGTWELPVLGNGNTIWNQAASYTTNTIFDNNWHMLTTIIEINGDLHVFVDGNYDPGANTTTDNEGNPAMATSIGVTNVYYTTNIYPYSTPPTNNPPPNGFVRWVISGLDLAGAATAFGGFDRNNSISGGPPVRLSDIGFWNRVLSPDEIKFVMTNGLPPVQLINFNPPATVFFNADLDEVGLGDQVGLHWNVSGETNISISGLGNVTALGFNASTNVIVNCDTNFTLTAGNGLVSDKSITVSIKAFPGVSPDWHLIQRFDGLFTDTTSGINGHGWVGHFGSISFHPDYWNVLTLTNGGGTNKILTPQSGYAENGEAGALAYGLLNGLTMPPNQSNTLFFRFALKDPGPNAAGFLSDLDCGIGLSDKPFFNGPHDVTGSSPGTAPNVGPFISIIRNSGGKFNGGPFDLVAQDYGGGSVTNMYSYIASVDPNGLQTNVNYYVWMDFQNNNTMAVTNPGVSTNTVNEALYSIWLQKQGDATRTLLFSNFHGNRDYVNSFDSPTPYLNKVFVSVGSELFTNSTPGAYITTNMIAVDDFYLSKNGFQSSIPRLLDIRSIASGTIGVTIGWDSLGSIYQTNTYTVQRKFNLTDPIWTTQTNGLPSGGDSTSFTDTTVGSSDAAFYRIVWP
jgi:hypothetical protein